jgi:hypothetical protein
VSEYRLIFTIQADNEEEAGEIMDSMILPPDLDLIDKEIDSTNE